MFGRIDHVGVAVEDIDAALPLYRDALRLELVHRETVEELGVDAALLDVGDGHVELIAPLEARTGVPVISSMPHGLWAGARLVGMSGAAPGYGKLLSRNA